mgnify:CR=1 FL=1
MGDEAVKKNRFLWTIRGRIAVFVTICMAVVILLTILANVVTARSAMVRDAENLLTEEADGNAAVINGWLKQEGNTVNTMKNALAVMDRDDTDAIMDYLEVNLNENENALMYYCCFGYDGGVLPADHSKLDLDPTTRDWWKQAISEDGLIYTEPYTDLWQRTISRLRIQLYLAGRSNCICKLRYLENEDIIDQWIGREIGGVNDSV